jgi:hypothetical protein
MNGRTIRKEEPSACVASAGLAANRPGLLRVPDRFVAAHARIAVHSDIVLSRVVVTIALGHARFVRYRTYGTCCRL